LSEKQANVAVAFYLQQLLKDRKDASISRHGRTFCLYIEYTLLD